MLRKLRIALAALFFTGITLLLAGIGAGWWGWMADVQFLPSVMRVIGSATALNIAILAALVVLTLLVGRIYCSVICPLGVWQDIVNWISSRRKGKKRRFHYKKENRWLRNGIWVLYFAALVADVQVAIALLAPYSAWGRIVQSVLNPMGMGWAVVAVAAVTLVVTGLLAWIGGRTYCNTICPVGTTLGIFSNFTLFGPVIDADKCTHCHGCEKQCKASCIDSENQKIDYSRCVDCFDCIDDCKFGAIRLGNTWKAAHRNRESARAKEAKQDVDQSKRAFLTGSALALGAVTLRAQEQKLDGGLAALEAKRKPERTERIVPAGARSLKDFYSRCTACQLCVANCPSGVLRPSTDLQHLMQPESSYEDGYCRPECVKCSEVCPAGAILPVTPEEKSVTHIGTAVVDYDLCVVNRDGVSCGNCARHCPAEAITMVPVDPHDRHSLKTPAVIEEKCIGCGACEYLCPSRPFSAIHVNGLKVHRNG
jgi:polyferredoxin